MTSEPVFAVPAVEFCAAADDVGADAIVAGLVVPGALTFLEGSPKAGKTTFLLGLVAAVLAGEDFLRLPTRCSSVVLASEESRATLREALARAGLDHELRLHVIAGGAARRLSWPELMAAAVSECERVGAPLLVVDTLPGLALLGGEAENDAGYAAEAVAPLREAADRGLAVLASRHARKGGGVVGEAGRGSNAFSGAADTLLLLARIEGGAPESRRLSSVSRFEGLPGELDCELVAGRWQSCRTPGQQAYSGQRLAVLEALADGVELTAEKVAAAVPLLSPRRAREHLEALAVDGLIEAAGAGKRGDPRRFRRIPAVADGQPTVSAQSEFKYSGAFPSATNRQKAPESRTLVSGVPAPPKGGRPGTARNANGGPVPTDSAAGGWPEAGSDLLLTEALSPDALVPGSVAAATKSTAHPLSAVALTLKHFPGATARSSTPNSDPPGPDEDGLPAEWLSGGYPA